MSLRKLAEQSGDRVLAIPKDQDPADHHAFGYIIEGDQAWEIPVGAALARGYWNVASPDPVDLPDNVREWPVPVVEL